MHFQRLLPVVAMTGFIDLGLAACHCLDASMAASVAAGCYNNCNALESALANLCHTGCTDWENSHNCVPQKKRSAAIAEPDETYQMVEDLVERDALDDIVEERAVESADAALDLNSCLGSCRSMFNASSLCRNNVGSLVGHAS